MLLQCWTEWKPHSLCLLLTILSSSLVAFVILCANFEQIVNTCVRCILMLWEIGVPWTAHLREAVCLYLYIDVMQVKWLPAVCCYLAQISSISYAYATVRTVQEAFRSWAVPVCVCLWVYTNRLLTWYVTNRLWEFYQIYNFGVFGQSLIADCQAKVDPLCQITSHFTRGHVEIDL